MLRKSVSMVFLVALVCALLVPASATAQQTSPGTGKAAKDQGKAQWSQKAPDPSPGTRDEGLSAQAAPACPATPAYSFTVADPPDDAFGFGPVNHEITSIKGEGDSGTFCLTVEFAEPIEPADGTGERNLVGFIEFDNDADPTTGIPPAVDFFCQDPAGIGVENGLDMFSISGGVGSMFPGGETVPLSFGTHSFTAAIPASAVGGDESFNFAMVLGSFLEPTDCAPNGGSIHSPDGSTIPVPDTDADGVPDGRDNCPTIPNPDQTDGDFDGVGDACDPTPTHDIALDRIRASDVTVKLEPGSRPAKKRGIMNVDITIRNLSNHPELAYAYVSDATFPVGCEVSLTTGDDQMVVPVGQTKTAHLKAYITCRPDLVKPGDYEVEVIGRVLHSYGIELNTDNNQGATSARLRVL